MSTKYAMQRLLELDLKLQYHTTLNPRLWDDGDVLKPEVRAKLLQFSKTWARFAKIDPTKILDVVMTGGNCNYNWTEFSDIDVHLIVDRASLGLGPATDEYLADKKKLWSLEHTPKVMGYSVEPYAQDTQELPPTGQGTYSLLRGVWLNKPVLGPYDFEHDPVLADKVQHYQDLIDDLVKARAPEEAFDNLKKKIGDMRKSGISRHGEFSRENLVFKSLRNNGYLDKMTAYLRDLQDKELSL